MTGQTKYVLLSVIGVWAAILAVLTVPNLVAVGRETRSVEQVFKNYISELIKGEYDKAYEFCGADFRSQLSEAQFSEQQAQLQSRFGRLASINQQGMKVSRTGDPPLWSAQFRADLYYANGPRRFEFAFRKQAGKWVLYGYQETGAVKDQ
jgi:hypothetical protein